MNDIWVVGAGSLGMLYAAKAALAFPGMVRLVTKTESQASLISRDGLMLREQVQGQSEGLRVTITAVSQQESLIEKGKPDWIWLTVKQTHIDEEFTRWIANFKHATTKVVCFQNGIGHIEKLAGSALMEERLFMAVSSEGARRLSGNEVAHTGSGWTRIGKPYDGSDDERDSEQIARILQACGFQAEKAGDIRQAVWDKLVVNAIINPLTALTGTRNGQLLECSSTRRLMRALFEEMTIAARIKGCKMDEAQWEQVLDVCKRTAGNRSSMLQDLQAGRPTEIDAINGSIVQIGEAAGVELPLHASVVRLIKAME